MTVTHVSVARPQFLDIETKPVSENIKRIVEFINSNAKASRKKLVEALAPTPRSHRLRCALPIPVPTASRAGSPGTADRSDQAAPAPSPPYRTPPHPPWPTPEQTAVISDLHWLVHQGPVLEFADGRMETAKKPSPRPPKPEKKPSDPLRLKSKLKPPQRKPPPHSHDRNASSDHRSLGRPRRRIPAPVECGCTRDGAGCDCPRRRPSKMRRSP